MTLQHATFIATIHNVIINEHGLYYEYIDQK